MEQPVVLLTGPTASGKSALALELARRLEQFGGATIINADSMQVYRELRILTARPTIADEEAVPHRLYGTLPVSQTWSAATFCAQARETIAETQAQGRIALVVGGTGLYLRALVEGLAPIPIVSTTVRDEARAMMDELGPKEFHQALAARDPETARTLGDTDRQRLTRAWEVLTETGRSLTDWQREPLEGGLTSPTVCAVVDVPRKELYRRIDARFTAIFEGGGIDEAAAFLATDPPPDAPARRAVGVREVVDFLSGARNRPDAIAAGQQATRRLAKRQLTWYRNQIAHWPRLEQHSETSLNEFFAKIRV